MVGQKEEFVVIQNFVLPNQMPQSFITGLVDALNSKVDKVTGKGLSANDFTTALKNKLDGLQNYVHPEFHQIGEIEDLPDALESKQDKEAGKALSTNDFTDAYKEQLDNPPVTYERVQDFSSNATIVGAIDGVNTIYDSSQNFEPGTMEIMLNGVDLSIDDDYTETGPNEVTFVEAPETGDKIIFRYQKALA